MNAQAMKSGASGVAATAVDVGLLVLLVRHGLPIPAAAFTSACAGAVTSFTMNKYVAFGDRSRITARQLLRFAFVSLATALIMAGAMELVAVQMRVPYVLAKIICAATVFVVWTYPAQRRLVFRRPSLAPSVSHSSPAHSH
jgi:putative flippase GtrA